MESLYTKYRPQTFADVVGQTHVVTTLERAVMEGRTSHAYLFCGPRGTGKTTMARLLAKALMCEQGAGHLPDGTCEQCRLIAAGEHPDVYELDAASRTGVDNVREEIISRVSFAPVRAPYKMYIIDEVHMLTTAAFNALLKTIEEPPAHVVFVLCTTDPQKIPETILSRVQRFDFHAISNADIQARLAYICEREGFGYDPEALELVVRHARGGMRDAISELEQLSVSGGGTITVDVARDVLGEVSASTLERMSLAMANRDVPTLFAQVESLVEVGRDLLQFTRALAGRLRDVYVVAAIGASSDTIQASDDELPAITREAKAFGSVDRVARALGLLSDASTEMRVAPNQRLVLEVALTKIARPQSELTLEALADRVSSLERQVIALSAPGARAVAAPAAAEKPKKAVRHEEPKAQTAPPHEPPATPVHPAQEAQAPASMPQQAAAAPVQAKRPVQGSQPAQQRQPAQVRQSAAPTPASTQAAPTPAPSAAVVDKGELQRKWKQVVDGLLASHPQHGSLLMNSTIVSDDGQTIIVSFPKGSAFACKMLDRKDVRANVDPMIASIFGHRTTQFGEGRVRPAQSGRSAGASIPRQAAPTQKKTAAPRQAPVTPAPQQQTPVQQAPRWQQTPAPRQQASAQQASAQQQTPVPQQRNVRQAPTPAPVCQQPAPQQGAPQSPASAYAAPWEPLPVDNDAVPYDDFDAAPYEEDFFFGQMDPQRAVVMQVGSGPQRSQPQPQQTYAVAQANTTPGQTYSAAPMLTTHSEPAQGPAPESVPTPEPDPAPAATPKPEPAPDSAPAQASESAPVSEPASSPDPTPASAPKPEPELAPAPKPKRSSRRAAGIPADIVSMMAEIFGEGVTYTAEVPDEEDDDIPLEDEQSDDDATESEFVDEAMDDADWEEEE